MDADLSFEILNIGPCLEDASLGCKPVNHTRCDRLSKKVMIIILHEVKNLFDTELTRDKHVIEINQRRSYSADWFIFEL